MVVLEDLLLSGLASKALEKYHRMGKSETSCRPEDSKSDLELVYVRLRGRKVSLPNE